MRLGKHTIVRRQRNKNRGQSFFEFTFGTIATVLLMLGMIEVFIWTGSDQVKQLQRHDAVLLQGCGHDGKCPLKQLNPLFFSEDGFRDAVNGDIYGDMQLRFDTTPY